MDNAQDLNVILKDLNVVEELNDDDDDEEEVGAVVAAVVPDGVVPIIDVLMHVVAEGVVAVPSNIVIAAAPRTSKAKKKGARKSMSGPPSSPRGSPKKGITGGASPRVIRKNAPVVVVDLSPEREKFAEFCAKHLLFNFKGVRAVYLEYLFTLDSSQSVQFQSRVATRRLELETEIRKMIVVQRALERQQEREAKMEEARKEKEKRDAEDALKREAKRKAAEIKKKERALEKKKEEERLRKEEEKKRRALEAAEKKAREERRSKMKISRCSFSNVENVFGEIVEMDPPCASEPSWEQTAQPCFASVVRMFASTNNSDDVISSPSSLLHVVDEESGPAEEQLSFTGVSSSHCDSMTAEEGSSLLFSPSPGMVMAAAAADAPPRAMLVTTVNLLDLGSSEEDGEEDADATMPLPLTPTDTTDAWITVRGRSPGVLLLDVCDDEDDDGDVDGGAISRPAPPSSAHKFLPNLQKWAQKKKFGADRTNENKVL